MDAGYYRNTRGAIVVFDVADEVINSVMHIIIIIIALQHNIQCMNGVRSEEDKCSYV